VTPANGDAPISSAWAAGQVAAAHTFVTSLDDSVEVAGADGHHLQRVRRLRVGEHVTAADGAGGWRTYEIDAIEPGRLRLSARGARRRDPELVPGVALAVALTKAGALDTVVARCTELGVIRITPVRSRRCVVQWDGAQAERAVERLRAVAREAAAQCRRAQLPEVAEVTDLADFAGRPDVVVADRTGGSIEGLPPASSSAWTVVVGPEGGLDSGELEAFAGARRLGIGPYILRSETAPIAAAAVLVSRARALFREW
jgi:16S rRNA (uracil1498-N3)-methyltransferase